MPDKDTDKELEPFEAMFEGNGPDDYVTKYDRGAGRNDKLRARQHARDTKGGKKARITGILRNLHIDKSP